MNYSPQPLVSVVIATFNMGQYLPEAIDSVLAQAWKNLEIIVVDDGSSDNTAEVMGRFDPDPRVRYIQTENRGQPKAKNLGLQEAAGDFIAFCDADDLWHPEKLRMQMPLFEQKDVGVVYSEVSYIDQHGLNVSKPQPYMRHSGQVTRHLVIKNFVPFGTAVIRRACIEIWLAHRILNRCMSQVPETIHCDPLAKIWATMYTSLIWESQVRKKHLQGCRDNWRAWRPPAKC